MTRQHELTRCAGYRVDTQDGSVGIVAAALPRAGDGRRGVLLVHPGDIYCRLVTVSFDQVETVDADAERVLIRLTRATTQEGTRSRARDQGVPGA